MYVDGLPGLEKAVDNLAKQVSIASKEVLTLEEAALYAGLYKGDFIELVLKKIPCSMVWGYRFKKSDIDRALLSEYREPEG